MTENDQIKVFLTTIFVIGVMAISQVALASLTLQPVVPGYSVSSGNFHAPAGSFSMAAANSGYIAPAVTNVGGKAVTVPATLRMAANAGQFAKNAMRLNPLAIVGTLAAGWLIDQGLEYLDGEWQKQEPDYSSGGMPCASTSIPSSWCTGYFADIEVFTEGLASGDPWPGNGCLNTKNWNDAPGYRGWDCTGIPMVNTPSTDDDWDALPDPLPDVSPELPYAPYMPEGVPVDIPDYDFAPFATPVGDPYEKMDGSTAQPMAKVSPNGDSVTVDTYDQPLTDPQGDPVPNAPPVDTPEPAPENKVQCDKYPNSLGCAELGTVDDLPVPEETRSIAAITPVSIGGAGSCPEPLTATFMGQSVSFSYDMPCQFASSLKPLILAIAWLSSGLIFIGGVRQ